MNPNVLISTLVTREISIKAMSLLKINVNKLWSDLCCLVSIE